MMNPFTKKKKGQFDSIYICVLSLIFEGHSQDNNSHHKYNSDHQHFPLLLLMQQVRPILVTLDVLSTVSRMFQR